MHVVNVNLALLTNLPRSVLVSELMYYYIDSRVKDIVINLDAPLNTLLNESYEFNSTEEFKQQKEIVKDSFSQALRIPEIKETISLIDDNVHLDNLVINYVGGITRERYKTILNPT